MAIAFGSIGTTTYQASGTLNLAYTMPAGSNGVLFVWNESGGAADPTSMTYNGVALTKIIAGVTGDAISLWALASPSTGANTLQVISAAQIFVTPVSYTGVKQSSFLDNSGSATGNSTSATKALTPVADNCWMVSYVQDEGTASFTATSTDVIRGTSGPFGDMCVVDTNTAIPAGVSRTQTVTVVSSAWFMVSTTIAPFVAPAATSTPTIQVLHGLSNLSNLATLTL